MGNHSTRDLPQASSLPKLRAFVAAVVAGHASSLRDAGVAAGLSVRHAHYYGLAATITLALAESRNGVLHSTLLGAELLATRDGSFEERAVLRRAIADSASVTSIAPDLLDTDGPTSEALTHRMIHAGLSPATAQRRASTLLAWRGYVLDRQARLTLPLAKVKPPLARSRRATR
ncbi:MAG: hypothetical protein M3Y87_09975 [Myxococcota bacterium]|nr:hypothetical protein [Myxococcota bacterium]